VRILYTNDRECVVEQNHSPHDQEGRAGRERDGCGVGGRRKEREISFSYSIILFKCRPPVT
jgi:hypothetical protein